MPSELIKQLLESGVHFGHKTSRWNPKMKKFIFGKRSGIYIIDLEKTEECLAHVREYLLDITSKGDSILFVGTKKQAQEVIQREAVRCGMYYVTERWLGGMLTNHETVKKSIRRLKEIESMKESGEMQKRTKKEISLMEKELVKLKNNFGGIAAMDRFPKALFIVDTKKEETAVREARRLNIPVIGLLDTNADPDLVAFPIPGNDDATKSIASIATYIAESIIEGRKKFLSYLSHETVAMQEQGQGEASLVGADEEVKIKEIVEIIEDTTKTDPKSAKKPFSGPVGADKSKLRKKV